MNQSWLDVLYKAESLTREFLVNNGGYFPLGYSGKSQWLTDGCWVNENRNGSLHCCCNHMTSFAVLGATEVNRVMQTNNTNTIFF